MTGATTKIPAAALVISCLLYTLLIGPFSVYMKEKPIEEKLGYLPSVKLIRYLCADHKESMAASLVLKTIIYFGGIVGKQQANLVTLPPDYLGMSRMLHGAVNLDPYNMDAYYFAQAFLVWDAKQIDVANSMLDYGMKYRSWDWYLPFFAGFNNAYFLKDYSKAAFYYRRVAELTGNALYMNITSRYLQYSGQTRLAIAYLSTMLENAHDEIARKTFLIRLNALQKVLSIEQARDEFIKSRGRLPKTVAELVAAGFLVEAPDDPYGGHFFLEPDGKVATTSNFAFASKVK